MAIRFGAVGEDDRVVPGPQLLQLHVRSQADIAKESEALVRGHEIRELVNHILRRTRAGSKSLSKGMNVWRAERLGVRLSTVNYAHARTSLPVAHAAVSAQLLGLAPTVTWYLGVRVVWGDP